MRNGSPRDLAARFPDHPIEVVQRVIMGPHDEDTDHHWHRLERGEISLDEARQAGKEAMDAAGIRPATPPADAPPPSSSPLGFEFLQNPEVIELLHDVRAAGLKTGMLTNNVREFRALWWPLAPWEDLFDDIVETPNDMGRLRTSILGRLAHR